MPPHKPGTGDNTEAKEEMMSSIHAVINYTGLNLHEVLDLPCDMFLLCVKNAMIEQLRKTKEGQDYLDDCERYTKTEPDREGLKKFLSAE